MNGQGQVAVPPPPMLRSPKGETLHVGLLGKSQAAGGGMEKSWPLSSLERKVCAGPDN